MSDLDAFQQRLGWTFRDPQLLKLALTHPSVAHGQADNLQHNQRLEFLGDAVLGLVLTKELFQKFPNFGEGPLTKGRAQMVNRRTLSDQARRLSVGDFLIMSHGEEANGGRNRQSALADAFEAIVGAVFLDGGLVAAGDFVLHCFQDSWGELSAIPKLDNPKGELQELLQSRSSAAPRYQMTASSGPDHDRIFECAVHHEGVELGRGRGKSKKAAESEAALAALIRLREERDASSQANSADPESHASGESSKDDSQPGQ